MTIHAALTNPTIKRFVALAAAYVLTLQALFGAGAQLRVALAETPGLCTLLGFQKPEQPKHVMDACTVHCVGHAAQDAAALAAIVAILCIIAAWTATASRDVRSAPRIAMAFQGRAPPR